MARKEDNSGNSDTQGDGGAAEVQKITDEAEEKGFLGEAVDETPRENYTLKGVNSGAPTPETETEEGR